MRLTLWLLVALAGTATAQWHRFGETASQSSLERGMLARHNTLRARVGVAPLAWSPRLAEVAQKWAATLLARKKFFHQPDSPYGENLYQITGASASPAQVIDAWAGESRNYDYSTNRCRGVCGHYTQMIWSSTGEVGCSLAAGRDREIWVCEYDPPGNWVGKRPDVYKRQPRGRRKPPSVFGSGRRPQPAAKTS